jgi:ferredoxin
MATIITEECINCGACEPECPNTAIYQGGVEYDFGGAKHAPIAAEIFYIVPEKCTECVGFFDYEACAAVCPVDCCVTDPGRPESEEVLIQRAKELHPDKQFEAPVPSRFNPQSDKSKDEAPVSANGAAAAAVVPAASAPSSSAPPVPAPSDVDIPIQCRGCGGEYAVAFRFFQPGTVLRCPHCLGSFTPTQRMFRSIAARLQAYQELLNAEIDRHNAVLETEHERFEAAAVALCDHVENEVRGIVSELSEPRKATIFG